MAAGGNPPARPLVPVCHGPSSRAGLISGRHGTPLITTDRREGRTDGPQSCLTGRYQAGLEYIYSFLSVFKALTASYTLSPPSKLLLQCRTHIFAFVTVLSKAALPVQPRQEHI